LNPDQPPSEHVVIQCPACGAAESAEAASLVEEAIIVCRECGESWPVGPARPRRRRIVRRRPPPPGGGFINAEKRALVTYSDNAESAWKAKIDGDYWPEPPRPPRLPLMAAGMAAALFLTAFFGAREAAVAALPDLAGLYAAVGLPVNLDGLAIENVGAERTPTFAGFKLKVHATVRNIGKAKQEIPQLATVLLSDSLTPSGTYGFDPPDRAVRPGEAIALTMEFDSAPKDAAEVVVRFRRRGETLAVAGAAEPATP
jgi:hypothetical protein